MSDAFSPAMQRFLAVALLVLALFCAVFMVVVPIFDAARAGLEELKDAKFALARLRTAEERPALPIGQTVNRNTLFIATGAPEARLSLNQRLAQLAASHQLSFATVEDAPIAGAKALIRSHIVVTGSEASLISFLSAVERGERLIRFEQWQLTLIELPTTPVADGASFVDPGAGVGPPPQGLGFMPQSLSQTTPLAGTIPAETLRFDGVAIAVRGGARI